MDRPGDELTVRFAFASPLSSSWRLTPRVETPLADRASSGVPSVQGGCRRPTLDDAPCCGGERDGENTPVIPPTAVPAAMTMSTTRAWRLTVLPIRIGFRTFPSS